VHWSSRGKPFNAPHYEIPRSMNRLNPKKLLLSKWTAVHPIAKQKHFLVSKIINPEVPNENIEYIELEAVYTKKITVLAWKDLSDSNIWIQGWK
jgi:tryptophan-rich hypothetical protein